MLKLVDDLLVLFELRLMHDLHVGDLSFLVFKSNL
jgi:hypothetical protein